MNARYDVKNWRKKKRQDKTSFFRSFYFSAINNVNARWEAKKSEKNDDYPHHEQRKICFQILAKPMRQIGDIYEWILRSDRFPIKIRKIYDVRRSLELDLDDINN